MWAGPGPSGPARPGRRLAGLLLALDSSGQDGANRAGPSVPPGSSPSIAASTPAATNTNTNAAILRGNRRTLIHFAEIDRDLALDCHSYEVEAADGTGTKSQFVLVPVGVDYLIKSLRGRSRHCVQITNITKVVDVEVGRSMGR